MTVLLSREDESKETQKYPLLSNQNGTSRVKHIRPRDTVRHVNEKLPLEEVIAIIFFVGVTFNLFFFFPQGIR